MNDLDGTDDPPQSYHQCEVVPFSLRLHGLSAFPTSGSRTPRVRREFEIFRLFFLQQPKTEFGPAEGVCAVCVLCVFCVCCVGGMCVLCGWYEWCVCVMFATLTIIIGIYWTTNWCQLGYWAIAVKTPYIIVGLRNDLLCGVW